MVYFSSDDRAMLESYISAAERKHPAKWKDTFNIQEMACLVAEECGELVREANNWREMIDESNNIDDVRCANLSIQSAMIKEAWQLMAVTFRMIDALREDM